MSAKIGAARARACEIVTAILHGDRDLALSVARGGDVDPLLLAVVSADLVAFVHLSWAKIVGMPQPEALEAWAQLMLDLAETA